jgi:hypothetical protein
MPQRHTAASPFVHVVLLEPALLQHWQTGSSFNVARRPKGSGVSAI